MRIAIVTGASSGMGREFVKQISENYWHLDEIWVISRNQRRLENLKMEFGEKIVPVKLDLRKKAEQKKLQERLARFCPSIKILVNAAGTGQIGPFEGLPLDVQRSTTRLNCEALMTVTYLCLPYMRPRSRIIQMASAAAFVPQPEFAVYAASKAYVLSFSRALGSELKERGITVTAVCPGPVDTPFFRGAEKYHRMPEFKKSSMAEPALVVCQAIRDAACGRELSVYGGNIKLLRLGCKLLPHSLIISATKWLEKQA